MTITEVLPTLKALNYRDKIRAIQFLANEVAREEEEEIFFEEGKTYEVWSPYESYEAAGQLEKMLDEGKKANV